MNVFWFFILWLCLASGAYAEEPWQRISVDAAVSEVTAIALDRQDDAVLYAGFEKGLYKSIDAGKNWELLAAGVITKINFLLLDNEDTKIIYTATENGLFRSNDAGMHWQRIFRGKDVGERDVASIALCSEAPKSVFIATANGIFFTPVNRITWQKIGGALSDARIRSIVVDPADCDTLFVASNKGLFKTGNRFATYEKLHSGFNPESEDSTTDIDSSEEETIPQDNFFKHVAFNAHNAGQIYAGTSGGVFFSSDGGKIWEKKVLSGLFDERLEYILLDTPLSKDTTPSICLATHSGVFRCREASCEHLYQGQNFSRCNQLAKDAHNRLYLAADNGLFTLSLESTLQQKPSLGQLGRKQLSQGEPAISEIQQAAINYAEVYPEKISNWRKQARMKAFFPEVDLSYDKTVYTSTSFPQGRGFVGPLDWGVTLSWDLGDFIFSTEQTSIDVRSRLMVQLRDDILNEVTRLYFERKRLQLELSKSDGLDEKARVEKELRLEELTASIDGLTGGYMSQKLKTKKK